MPQLSQKLVVPVVYVAAVFMSILDSTVVDVTLPSIARQFDVQPEQGHAVIIGYLLSLAVFMPVSGWLADRFGAKRVFLTALGDVRGGVGAVRDGAEPAGARGVPGGAGRGRRRAGARRHGHGAAGV